MPDLPIKQFMSKLNQIKGINVIFEKALLLYVLLIDADTPLWAKAVVIAALLYLIDPLDAIPDITPFVGFLDDLTVLATALKTVSQQIQPHHKNQAELLISEL